MFDFNNDGAKDLFAACGSIDDNVEEFSHRSSRQPNLLLANIGAARFAGCQREGRRRFPNAAWNRGAAFGDLDGDGRVDVVVSRIGERAAIFRNTSAAAQPLPRGPAARHAQQPGRPRRDGASSPARPDGSSGIG